MSSFPLDVKQDSSVPAPAVPSPQQRTRSIRRRLALTALLLWVGHATVSLVNTPVQHDDHSVTAQLANGLNSAIDWAKWHCKPLPKDPRERALALLSRYPIVGQSQPPLPLSAPKLLWTIRTDLIMLQTATLTCLSSSASRSGTRSVSRARSRSRPPAKSTRACADSHIGPPGITQLSEVDLTKPFSGHVDIPRLREGKVGQCRSLRLLGDGRVGVQGLTCDRLSFRRILLVGLHCVPNRQRVQGGRGQLHDPVQWRARHDRAD